MICGIMGNLNKFVLICLLSFLNFVPIAINMQ